MNPLYREFHSRTFLRPVMFASSANKYYPPDFHSDHTAAMLHYYVNNCQRGWGLLLPIRAPSVAAAPNCTGVWCGVLILPFLPTHFWPYFMNFSKQIGFRQYILFYPYPYNFCYIPDSLIFAFNLAHFGLKQNSNGLQKAI